jgi:hypothetical protein
MAQLFLSAGRESSGKTTIAIGHAAALSGAMPEETARTEAPWFESFVAFVHEGVAAHGLHTISPGPTARAQRGSPRTQDDADA